MNPWRASTPDEIVIKTETYSIEQLSNELGPQYVQLWSHALSRTLAFAAPTDWELVDCLWRVDILSPLRSHAVGSELPETELHDDVDSALKRLKKLGRLATKLGKQ